MQSTGQIEIILPRTLVAEADGQRHVRVEVSSEWQVADVLRELRHRYPILVRRLQDETGALRRFVNLYVDGEDVRQLDGLATPISGGQQIQVIQSVAGGGYYT
jgi:sulfur-carrier protein